MAWSTRSRHERGYDSKWSQVRLVALRRDRGLCVPCLSDGKVTVATEVDHVLPKARGGADDPKNLQSICRACHKAKTLRDEGRKAARAARAVGLDGYPIA